MDDCCQIPTSEPQTSEPQTDSCPECFEKGKPVQMITIKSMLTPTALATIDPNHAYAFCSNPTCDVVYFSETEKFSKDSVQVPVFQKEAGENVPVCYCFGWTRKRLVRAMEDNIPAKESITQHVTAQRCGCEVNNPQGSCCLGNVTAFLNALQTTEVRD